MHPDQVDLALEKIRPRVGPAPHGESLSVIQAAGTGRGTGAQDAVDAKGELPVPVSGHGHVVIIGGIQAEPGAGSQDRSAAGVRDHDLHRPAGTQTHLKA